MYKPVTMVSTNNPSKRAKPDARIEIKNYAAGCTMYTCTISVKSAEMNRSKTYLLLFFDVLNIH